MDDCEGTRPVARNFVSSHGPMALWTAALPLAGLERFLNRHDLPPDQSFHLASNALWHSDPLSSGYKNGLALRGAPFPLIDRFAIITLLAGTVSEKHYPKQ